MPTRNVVLTQYQEDLIETLVKKGRYQNASEVLRDGLRLIELRDAEHEAKLEWLRREIQIGEDAFERGDFKEFPDAESLRDYLDQLAKEAIDGEDDR
jgi:antitoxin ParD1/3/4